MGLINGQLKSAQLEYFTLATRPAASSMLNRVIYVTDLAYGQIQTSNGTDWVPQNILESCTTAGRPSPSLFAGQVIYVTDLGLLGSVQYSTGSAWVTVGASTGSISFKANGKYVAGSSIDIFSPLPFAVNITSVWICNGTAGTAGTTEFDLKRATTSGGAFTSIFSTTGKITSAAASNVWTDSGVVVSAQTGVTKPVLSTISITAGSALRLDLITTMTGARDCELIVQYEKA